MYNIEKVIKSLERKYNIDIIRITDKRVYSENLHPQSKKYEILMIVDTSMDALLEMKYFYGIFNLETGTFVFISKEMSEIHHFVSFLNKVLSSEIKIGKRPSPYYT